MTYKCRWCPKTSTAAPGINAHERGAHPKQYAKAKAEKEDRTQKVEEVVPPADKDKDQVIDYFPLAFNRHAGQDVPPAREITVDQEFNTKKGIEAFIQNIDLRLEFLKKEIQAREVHVKEYQRLEFERQELQAFLDKIQPKKEVGDTFHNQKVGSERQHDRREPPESSIVR